MSALNTKTSGFTILEALIYIALFAFIITGGLFTALQIFEGTAQVEQIAEREMELNFLLRKIKWALNEATAVTVPSSDSLRILHSNGELYEFFTGGTLVTLVKNGEAYNLSTPRLQLSVIDFKLSATNPQQLEITLTVAGKKVGPLTYYLK